MTKILYYPDIYVPKDYLDAFKIAERLKSLPPDAQRIAAMNSVGATVLTLEHNAEVIAALTLYAPTQDTFKRGWVVHTNYLWVEPNYPRATQQLIELAMSLGKQNGANWLTISRKHTDNSCITRYFKL